MNSSGETRGEPWLQQRVTRTGREDGRCQKEYKGDQKKEERERRGRGEGERDTRTV